MIFNRILLSDVNIDTEERKKLASQVYFHLQELNKDYNEFYSWYYSKVLPQVEKNIRNIVIVGYKNEIAGIAITKNHLEKKICTLRVTPKYQKSGVGKILFESAFNLLETEKPIITVSESRSFEFRRILNYYGFNLEKVYHNYYKNRHAELSYNGLLNPYGEKKINEEIRKKILAV